MHLSSAFTILKILFTNGFNSFWFFPSVTISSTRDVDITGLSNAYNGPTEKDARLSNAFSTLCRNPEASPSPLGIAHHRWNSFSLFSVNYGLQISFPTFISINGISFKLCTLQRGVQSSERVFNAKTLLSRNFTSSYRKAVSARCPFTVMYSCKYSYIDVNCSSGFPLWWSTRFLAVFSLCIVILSAIGSFPSTIYE